MSCCAGEPIPVHAVLQVSALYQQLDINQTNIDLMDGVYPITSSCRSASREIKAVQDLKICSHADSLSAIVTEFEFCDVNSELYQVAQFSISSFL